MLTMTHAETLAMTPCPIDCWSLGMEVEMKKNIATGKISVKIIVRRLRSTLRSSMASTVGLMNGARCAGREAAFVSGVVGAAMVLMLWSPESRRGWWSGR